MFVLNIIFNSETLCVIVLYLKKNEGVKKVQVSCFKKLEREKFTVHNSQIITINILDISCVYV